MVGTSVIIPCWNCLEHTRLCLACLEDSSSAGFEAILVDNASTDGTASYLKRWSREFHRPVRLILNRSNRGYASAMNQGIETARGRYLAFLNNDILMGPGWLGRSERVWESVPGLGGVSTSFNRSGLKGKDFWQAPEDAARKLRIFGEAVSLYCSDKIVFRTGFISGAYFFTSRTVLDRVGVFDERFHPGGFEDLDLQIRMANAGYRLALAMGVDAYHFVSASFAGNGLDRDAWDRRNRALLVEKWRNRFVRSAAHRRYLDRLRIRATLCR